MSKPGARRLRILFCGADSNWNELSRAEIHRRNLYFLHGFGDDPEVELFVLHRSTRLDALRTWVRQRLGDCDSNPRFDGMTVVHWLPERRWLPLTKTLNRMIARRWLRRRLEPHSEDAGDELVLWCYGLRGIALAEWLEVEAAYFLDTDHDVVHDPNRSYGETEEVEGMVLRISRRALRVFSASRRMLSWLRAQDATLRRDENRLVRLRNGVDLDRFDAPDVATPAGEAGRPTFGYVGVLSPWIDWDLFVTLARRRPGWRFVIAGSWYRMQAIAELGELENVELRGAVAADAIPGLLSTFDLALGLYRREPWLDVDSMKLYEYLAAGVPVITTPFHDHLEEDFEGLLTLASSAAAFEAHAVEILGRPESERREWAARTRDFARRNSWSVRTAEALKEIRQASEASR